MKYSANISSAVAEAMLTERITFSDNVLFRTMIAELLAAEPKTVALDLSQVAFIDSSGLGMLLLARDEVLKNGKDIVLRKPQGQVAKLFALSDFDSLFRIES
jgi:anti-anti-sigma factor